MGKKAKRGRGRQPMPVPESLVRSSPEGILAWFFHRNGYFRTLNAERREKLGSKSYKKGYEVRLVARNKDELKLMRSALLQVNFAPGNPFAKAKSTVVPIYGKGAVEFFRAITKKWTKKKLAELHGL